MRSPDSPTTRLDDYLVPMLPWAHGHQRTGLRDFVQALSAHQTGCPAQLARSCGQQEAATKRVSRRLHNVQLAPRPLAAAVLLPALGQLPAHGPGRRAIDGTSDGQPHRLVVSWIVGRRAVPLSWRASNAAGRQGRLQRDAGAVIGRALPWGIRQGGRRRGRVTADRGCADVARCTLRTDWRVACVLRVQKSPQRCLAGVWRRRDTLRLAGHTRRHPLGRLLYGASPPQALWGTRSRPREAQGKGGSWYLGAKRPYPAAPAVAASRHRPGCAAGWRAATGWLGLAQARLKQSAAWSRLCAVVALALLVVVSLASRLLLRHGGQASAWLRRGTSRRRGRCALSRGSAMISVLHQEPGLYAPLVPRMQRKLDGD